jgi:chaperonin GroES
MTLQPLGDHVILKTEEKQTVTASGIIIPDTAGGERPERGVVVAVGKGRTLDNGMVRPIEVAVGDTVLFKKYAPDEVEIEGVKYLVVRNEDLMAIVK